MIFMVALIAWAVLASLVTAGLCGTVFALRYFGFLATDGRVCVLVAAVVSAFALHLILQTSFDFQIPEENLKKGLYYACWIGGVVGLALMTLGFVGLAWVIKSGEPRTLGWVMAVVYYVTAIAASVWTLYAPGSIQKYQKEMLENYERALADGDVETVRSILSGGFRRKDLAQDLRSAIRREDEEMMALLLEPPRRKLGGLSSYISLVRATKNESLLKRYLSFVDRQATMNAALKAAILDGDEDEFEWAMKHGADPNYQYSHSLLMHAAMNNRITMAKRLIEEGAEIDRLTRAPSAYSGSTALIWAVQKGHLEMASVLLRAGADVNLTASKQETALHQACRADSPRMVKLLVAFGANIEVKNRQGNTALDIAERRPQVEPEILAVLRSAVATN